MIRFWLERTWISQHVKRNVIIDKPFETWTPYKILYVGFIDNIGVHRTPVWRCSTQVLHWVVTLFTGFVLRPFFVPVELDGEGGNVGLALSWLPLNHLSGGWQYGSAFANRKQSSKVAMKVSQVAPSKWVDSSSFWINKICNLLLIGSEPRKAIEKKRHTIIENNHFLTNEKVDVNYS